MSENAPCEGQSGQRLSYDAVIATRNRPEALALSIPLLLSQSRSPQKLIVIDSSEDHAAVAATVAEATRGWDGAVICINSAPGLTLQRNIGLTHVTSPIVLFPDDDSLLYPGAAAHILSVYERDSVELIAGVAAAEAMSPPPDIDLGQAYQPRIESLSFWSPRGLQHRLERRIGAVKPALALGRALNERYEVPTWFAEMDIVPVEYMTGFRMSFRTEAIRPIGFDETLGGYALEEDVDASFTAMRAGLVVGARKAQIYHHRFPGVRASGRILGAIEVLNRYYVGLKHIQTQGLSRGLVQRLRRQLRTFVWIKLLAGLPGVRSAFGRDRLAGAFAARRAGQKMWRAEPAQLQAAYKAALDEVLGG